MNWKYFLILFFIQLSFVAPGQAERPVLQTGAFGREQIYAERFMRQSELLKTDPQIVQEVLQRAKNLQSQGLPVTPLFLKASEGITKRISLARFIPAIDQTRARILSAKNLVDQAVANGSEMKSKTEEYETLLEFHQALLTGSQLSTLQELVSFKDFNSSSRPTLKQLQDTLQEMRVQKSLGFTDGFLMPVVLHRLKTHALQNPPISIAPHLPSPKVLLPDLKKSILTPITPFVKTIPVGIPTQKKPLKEKFTPQKIKTKEKPLNFLKKIKNPFNKGHKNH